MEIPISIFLITSIYYLIVTFGWRLAQGRGFLDERHYLGKLVWAAIIVVVFFAISGLIIALAPFFLKRFLSLFIIGIAFVSSILAIRSGALKALVHSCLSEKICIFGSYTFAIAVCMLAWLPVSLPTQLIDGPYVVKKDLPVVRIQHITGDLPIDNAIPHVVSEYIVRDISFEIERPILPGQEVSNRPIFTSLFLVPWRIALKPEEEYLGTIPRFNYVGQSWPDFSIFLQDQVAWAISLSLGVALNSLILLAAAAWMTRARDSNTFLAIIFLLLASSSPYIVFQTMFTWPKNLAGFFIIAAWLAYDKSKFTHVVAFILGIAYLCHPFAIVFAGCYFLNYIYEARHNMRSIGSYKNALIFIFTYTLVISPWFIWTKIFLDIPSDLILQNFIQNGQSLSQFLWVRIVNLANVILPHWLSAYPFDANFIVRASSVSLTGGVGVISIALLILARPNINYDTFFTWIMPTSLLVLIFSNLAVPSLHGLQPLALLLIAAAGYYGEMRYGTLKVALLLSTQILFNCILLVIYLQRLL